MPAFEYSALDASGRGERGVLQADTPRAARASLRERGLNPLEVTPFQGRPDGGWPQRLSGAQLAVLSRQLAVLVGSGLPIDEALAALAESNDGRIEKLVVALRARVMEGTGLAAAMADQGASFPDVFRASVAAGESSGRLASVLRRLADHAEARDVLRRRVLLALTYPALLSVVAIVVVVAMLIYVVPQITSVFATQQVQLPWATRALLALSGWIQNFGAWLLLLLIMVGAIVGLALRNPELQLAADRFVLGLPILGRLLRAADSARFARTLALLVGSAVPLLESLIIAGKVVQRLPLRSALGRVASRVREGQSFARALAESREFPPITVHLIQSGERSGRLEDMLAEAAAQQERELDTAVGVATNALGPGVILVVGGLVLFIVLAILLPIFDLNNLVK